MFKMSQCNIYCCAPGGGLEMKCSLCLSDEGWTQSTSLPRSGGLTACYVGEKLYQLCRSVFIHIWQRPSLSHLFLDHKWRELLFQPIRPPRWHHSVSSFNTSANFFFFFSLRLSFKLRPQSPFGESICTSTCSRVVRWLVDAHPVISGKLRQLIRHLLIHFISVKFFYIFWPDSFLVLNGLCCPTRVIWVSGLHVLMKLQPCLYKTREKNCFDD